MHATCVLQEKFILQSPHELTEDIYKMYIGMVRTNVWQLLPSTVVEKLQCLFDVPTGKHLLTISDHAEVRESVESIVVSLILFGKPLECTIL